MAGRIQRSKPSNFNCVFNVCLHWPTGPNNTFSCCDSLKLWESWKHTQRTKRCMAGEYYQYHEMPKPIQLKSQKLWRCSWSKTFSQIPGRVVTALCVDQRSPLVPQLSKVERKWDRQIIVLIIQLHSYIPQKHIKNSCQTWFLICKFNGKCWQKILQLQQPIYFDFEWLQCRPLPCVRHVRRFAVSRSAPPAQKSLALSMWSPNSRLQRCGPGCLGSVEMRLAKLQAVQAACCLWSLSTFNFGVKKGKVSGKMTSKLEQHKAWGMKHMGSSLVTLIDIWLVLTFSD